MQPELRYGSRRLLPRRWRVWMVWAVVAAVWCVVVKMVTVAVVGDMAGFHDSMVVVC